jgi:glucosamine kinase
MKAVLAVGVDAGGSSTVVAFSRAGTYQGAIAGGPANPSSRGIAAAAQTIASAVRAIAGSEDPAAIYVGAAGAGRPESAMQLEAALRGAFPAAANLAVASDVETALRAAVPNGPGVVVIAGTGAVAYAENGELRAQVGGDGYLLGDEGSGFALGFHAVKRLARALDGRAAFDETTALVQEEFGVSDRDGLLAAVYGGPLDVARVASLAPKLIELARDGKSEAARSVGAAAQTLGEMTRLAAEQAGLARGSTAVVFAGGLLRDDNRPSSLLRTHVRGALPGATILRSGDEPVRAALRFAEAMLG